MRYRINGQIRANQVRLIDKDRQPIGVMSLKDALALRDAKQIEEDLVLDLVEISPTAEPPVVQMLDYKKFLFEENKRKAQAKKKQKQIKTKEVKFRPSTGKGDYEVKLRNLRGFLEEGDKVKVTVFFRGREITHQELGFRLLEQVKEDLNEYGKVDFFPRNAEGRQLVMIMSPKKK